MRKQLAFLAFSIIFLFAACRKLQKTPEYYSTVAQFVYAYTSGSVSVKEPIKIRFVNPVVGAEKVGQPIESGLFSINPSIKGVSKWEDDHTLLFTPDEALPRNQKFTATLQLKRLFKAVPKIAEVFEFEFQAKQLDFIVLTDGIRAEDINDLTKQSIVGRVRTSDAADINKVEQILSATQNGNALKINWSHGGDGSIHDFIIVGVQRGKDPSKVVVHWDGQPLGVSKKDKTEIEIPALGDFKIMDVRVETNEEVCAILNFSDPLLPSQNLDGLITLIGWDGKFRTVIDRNFVRAYPSKRLTGGFKLRVSAGIKNTANAPMKNGSEWNVQFEDLKPAVRLVGKGSILPNVEGAVLFPFEAVSLN